MTQTKTSKHLHDKTGMQNQPIQIYITLAISNNVIKIYMRLYDSSIYKNKTTNVIYIIKHYNKSNNNIK